MVFMFRSFTPVAVAAVAVAALGAAPAPDGTPVTLAVAGRANAHVVDRRARGPGGRRVGREPRRRR